MSATITIDAFYLFFILLVFLFNMASLKFPFISILAVFVVMVCILPTLAETWVDNQMIGWLGIIMTMFTFGVTIMNVVHVVKEK